MINAGALRHRVTIQRRAHTRDAAGGVIENWAAHSVRWAAVEPLEGRELEDARRTLPTVTHKVRFRDGTDVVNPKDRVKFGSRILNVESAVKVDERGFEIAALCTEAVT